MRFRVLEGGSGQEKEKEKEKEKEEIKGYFQDKLRAIENINDYLLTSDDETIFRTEKFIESILTKKR